MNTRIKKLWVEALRDPEAVQIKWQLRDDGNGRCCLGVLCDIAVGESVVKWHGNMCENSSGALPTKVLEWAEMDMSQGPKSPGVIVKIGYSERSLWDLNDRARLTFAQIADIIEAQL